MASIVFRELLLSEEQEPPDAPRSASAHPTTKSHVGDYAGQGANGGPGEAYWSRDYVNGGGRRSEGGSCGRICWVVLSVLIPAIVISVLRTICRAAPPASSAGEALASTRRLSESEENRNGDGTPRMPEEECAAVEAGLGLYLRQESSSHHGLDAADHVERIAFALYQDALAFESEMQQAQPQIRPTFLPPSLANLGIHYQHEHRQGAANIIDHQNHAQDPQSLTSSLETTEHQPGGFLAEPTASSAQPLGGAYHPAFPGPPSVSGDMPLALWHHQGAFASPQPTVEAHQPAAGPYPLAGSTLSVDLLPQGAPLLPLDDGWSISMEKGHAELSEQVYPELDPDSWLDEIPGIGNSPEGQVQSERLSPDAAASPSDVPCKDRAEVPKSRTAGQSSSPPSADRGREDSAAVTAPPTGRAANFHGCRICKHPYVRLPILQQGVVPPCIQLWDANFRTSNNSSVIEILLSIRQLFTRQDLGQMEATLLVANIQQLATASAARARLSKRMLRPLHGVVTIGRHFLILDAIVSALHVLEVAPLSCTWWEAFIQCFDAEYRYPEPHSRTQDSGRVNINIANRMLAAMSLYKRGYRPAPEEIIDVKKTLFFSPFVPSRFRDPKWDPWRADHELFEQQRTASSE
ncbi:hypothetical protein EPH_0006390 [Eimeria praecox]|uniref:Uncharacterized protein n=1 Tax=Eimeria praecox TaxID=51316 RepID=U6G8K5_9EIME|nr:hypothetical protein EPH_0006390 [Eimeria praecox]